MLKLTVGLMLMVSVGDGADFNQFAAAIAKVESNNNSLAIGDKGKAFGKYQIQISCFKDAAAFDKELSKYEHKHCFNDQVGKRVLWSYCRRYEPTALKNGDWQTLARLWNSGPAWQSKKNKTEKYWQKISLNLPK